MFCWVKNVTKETWVSVVGFVLAIVLTLMVFLGVVASGKKMPVADAGAETVNYDDCLVVIEGESHGIALLSTSFVKVVTVNDVKKDVKVERITASFDEGFDSDSVALDWEITGWKNSDHNEWATDKNALDYVGVTPTSDGALEADVSCYQPFGEIAILRASVRGNSDIYAECELGYLQGFVDLYANIVYENEENSKMNLAWELGEEENAILPFAGVPSSLEEFVSDYGASTGTTFMVNSVLTDVYTDEAIVENVKVDVCYNYVYREAILLNGGKVSCAPDSYISLGFGNGKTAEIKDVNFINILMLPETGLNYAGFKKSMKESADSANICMRITATVNKKEYTKLYTIRFDTDSFVLYPGNVELDNDRVVFGE